MLPKAGAPEGPTTNHLRASGASWGDYDHSSGWIYWYGEEDWYTNATAVERTKAGITYCNTHNLTLSAIGLGWCADLTEGIGTAGVDPVYGCHWYGNSINGPEGDHPIGINADDFSVTGNTVCMDTYLRITQEYNDFCISNGYPTKVYFTTGPVDADDSWYGEKAYQGNLKHEYIRNYVKADPSRILFDYADILCYDNDGSPATETWNGHTFPVITSANVTPVQTGHISNTGAIRLAKAMWWMLARIAGWNGIITDVPKTEAGAGISVINNNKSDEIRIQTPETFLSGQISLYNLNGTLIEKKVIDSNTSIFNKSKLSPGLYLVKVNRSNLSETKKIIILY